MKSWPLIILIFLIAAQGCKSENQQANREDQTQFAQQVSIWIDSCWNQRSFKALQDLSSAKSTRYMNGVKVAEGPAEMEAHLQLFFTAFPDLVITADNV